MTRKKEREAHWLTAKKQLDKIMYKAYEVFWICRDTFRKMWRLRLKALHWTYIMAVRSMKTCAATVWCRVEFKTSTAEVS